LPLCDTAAQKTDKLKAGDKKTAAVEREREREREFGGVVVVRETLMVRGLKQN
jgi:hypothetical protein